MDSKATTIYHRFSKSKKDKACEPVQNPQIVKVDKHAFLLCDSKDLNEKCDFLGEYAKEVRVYQTLCMDDIESKTFFGLGKEDSKLKFISLKMKKSESSASNEFSVDSTTYGKLEDTGPILLDDNKTVVGCFRKTTDNSKISISIFGENQVQESSSANDIHPTITSSTSKTNPSCNGTSSSNDLPSRNDNPSSNDNPSFNGILSCNGIPSKNNPSSNGKPSFNGILSRNDFLLCNGIPSRNDNPPSNFIPSRKSTASSNSSQKGSDLETRDHSDGSQSTRQMADDEKRERRSSKKTKLCAAFVVLIVLGVAIYCLSSLFFKSGQGKGFIIGFTCKDRISKGFTCKDRISKGFTCKDRISKGFTCKDLYCTTLCDIFRLPGVKDGLCERLDPEYKELSNWKHLADRVKAPTSVKEECSINTKNSPTKLLLEVPKVSSERVNFLLMALLNINRHDVHNKIIEAIPENKRNMKVSETLLSNDYPLDDVAVLLDNSRREFPNNWEILGQTLGVPRTDLEKIKRGNNPTDQLLQFAHGPVQPEKLTTGFLHECFTKNHDFWHQYKIDDQDNRLIKNVFKSDRDMSQLCGHLNSDAGGTQNDWKYLAYKWGIHPDIYNKFDEEKPSPTKVLLDWLIKEYPNFTVSEFCEHLVEMGRSDVKDFLLEKTHEYFDVRR